MDLGRGRLFAGVQPLIGATPATSGGDTGGEIYVPAVAGRSVSEVYMHIAVANFFLLNQAGAKVENAPKITQTTEKDVKDKAAVIGWLKDSFDALRKAYPTAELQKPAKFFGRDSKVENIYLRILVHNHEHIGQSIAYARMNGIVPPWSK